MINQTITEIGEEAFSNCPNLNNIYIKGQIDKIKIKKNAFLNCGDITFKFLPIEEEVKPVSETPEIPVVQETSEIPPLQEESKVPLNKEKKSAEYIPVSSRMIFVEGNHKINSFYMDMYEMDEHTYCQLIDIKNYHKDQMYYPVTFVDFIAAIKFCNLLSIKEGFTPCYSFNGTTDVDDWHISVSNNALSTTWKDDDGNVRNIRGSLRCNFDADGYRLPTIEEWLYAAKGGKKPDYYNFPGSNDVDSVAVTGRNAKQVQPSGTLAPNKLGLYDLCGNIGEWCWDIKDRIYSPVCGGSVYEWFQLDGFPDSSWWKNSYRQISYYSSGFRVVRSAPKEENE